MYFDDEIFEKITEDVSKETVSVESDENRGWKHYIGFTDGGFTLFYNYTDVVMKDLKAIKRAFEMLGVECSEIGYIPKIIDAFNDYHIEPLVEDISTNKDKSGFIAFCFDDSIRFSPAYHIASAISLMFVKSDHIGFTIDSYKPSYTFNSSIEKYKDLHKNICCRICDITEDEYQKKYTNMFRLERSFRRYNIKFIKKIANSRFASKYKFLNCFDVFDDCTIKEKYGIDASFADAWVADLKMMLGFDNVFNSQEFIPKMIDDGETFESTRIVRSEVIHSESNILVILELDAIHNTQADILTTWLSFTASSYSQLSERLKIILSSENDAAVIAEIISDEMYFATNNSNFRTR